MLGNFCQSFKISSDRVKGAKVIFITSVDLLFKDVPQVANNPSGFDNPGVTVQICDTKINTHGIHAPQLSKILPNSTRTKSASVISPNVWTNFKFNGPLPIKPDTMYAIVISFDGEAPFILAAKSSEGQGETGITAYQDGHLFVNSDGELKVYSDVDLAFRVRIAKFDMDYSGEEIEVLNDAFEFFHLNELDGEDSEVSPFAGDEVVVGLNTTPEDGNIVYNSGTNLILGVNTSFDTVLGPGSKVLTANQNSLLGAPDIEFLVVNNVINSTAFYATNPPGSNSAEGYYFYSPLARVFNYIVTKRNLTCWDSSASNSDFKFSNGDVLLAIESNTIFTINEVLDYPVQKFGADLGILTPPDTEAVIRVALANTEYEWDESHFLKTIPGTNNIYKSTHGIIASRSNEVSNPTNLYDPGASANNEFRYKSLVSRVRLSTENEYTSPYWKSDMAKLMLFSLDINDDLEGETGRYGNAKSKYVSKVVTLSDGLDAEDLRVFVTVAKPAGTNIQPYAKITHSADSIPFEDHPWTPLVLKNTTLLNTITADVSQTGQALEVVELEYGFSNRLDENGDLLYVANGAQLFVTTEGGNNVILTNFDPANTVPSNLEVGDMVGIYNPGFPDIHWITIVNSIINSTSFSTVEPAPSNEVTDGSGNFIYKVREDFKLSSFNNSFNQNIIRYFAEDSFAIFDTYRSFAIKVVLLSEDTNVEPQVYDLRGIAVSA